MTIKLEFNLPEDFFDNILDRDPEWAESNTVTSLYSKDFYIILSCEMRPHWGEGKPFEDGDCRNDWQLVDHAKIEAAIQRIVSEKITNDPIRNTIFDAVCEGDTCYLDMDCRDAILQIAMFGELIFG